ncbi:MAG: hypothetical protein LBR51_01685 [Bacteroidales bacterium]|jgi:hypothetical protein|nr:hypothetical protein [Bacteroidales bacterium]
MSLAKKINWLSIPFLSTVLLMSCVKKCECTRLDENGESTEEVMDREMPRNLHLDCSFFDHRLDTTKLYRCE